MLIEAHARLLDSLISQHGLEVVAETIKQASYTRVGMTSAGEETYAALGTSRFGGNPDIPIDCSWLDRIDGMVFVFQVCLSDLNWSASLGLPETGVLYVFSDQEADSASTFYFPGTPDQLTRHRMPAPEPDYHFSNMKCFRLKASLGIDLPEYGSDEFYEIEDAGLDEKYEIFLSQLQLLTPNGESYCQLAGRYADINGDLRKKAAEAGGGIAQDWRSLWKVFSSYESGLVISDFHVLHGMIKDQDLRSRNFSNVYSVRDLA